MASLASSGASLRAMAYGIDLRAAPVRSAWGSRRLAFLSFIYCSRARDAKDDSDGCAASNHTGVTAAEIDIAAVALRTLVWSAIP